MRQKVLLEIIEYCEKRKEEDHLDINNNEDPLCIIISYFTRIRDTLLLSNTVDTYFCKHVKTNLLHNDEKEHLPVPVFSCIIPTMGMSFFCIPCFH